jgi:hypothetical protein
MFNILNNPIQERKELADGVQIPLRIVLAAGPSFAIAAWALCIYLRVRALENGISRRVAFQLPLECRGRR